MFVGENPKQVYRSTPSVTAVADFQYKMSVKRTPTEAGNRERVQTAHHRATDGFPSRLLSVVLFWMGRCALVIELRSSNARERLVQTRRYGFESRPETSKPTLVHLSAFSTGRRIGLSPPKRVVAGSSPASGSRCRGSSVVEHVFPVRFLSVGSFSGPRNLGYQCE